MKLAIKKLKYKTKQGFHIGLSATAVAGSFMVYNAATAPEAEAKGESFGRNFVYIGPQGIFCGGSGGDCVTIVI